MNRYLKNLCELAGFNKPITRTCYRAGQRVEETYPKYEMIGTHAGRRTFNRHHTVPGHPAAGGDEMDRPLRLPGHETVYRHCREDEGRRNEAL